MPQGRNRNIASFWKWWNELKAAPRGSGHHGAEKNRLKAIGSNQSDDQPLVTVAQAVRTTGLKGELVADLLTDFPERFDHQASLVAVAPDGSRQPVVVERFRLQSDRVVLKLAGFDTVEAATTLVGYQFAVPEAECVRLAEGEFYDWQLEGCEMKTVAGRQVGTVTRILRTGAADVLEVDDGQGHSHLVPMVSSILVRIDVPQKSVVIDPPEGLLDL
jgi:16S rRNA processing protein RimM